MENIAFLFVCGAGGHMEYAFLMKQIVGSARNAFRCEAVFHVKQHPVTEDR